MFFDLKKYAENTAVEMEHGLKMAYAELEKASQHVTACMDARKLTFCLCENTIGSFVGYVGLMNANKLIWPDYNFIPYADSATRWLEGYGDNCVLN